MILNASPVQDRNSSSCCCRCSEIKKHARVHLSLSCSSKQSSHNLSVAQGFGWLGADEAASRFGQQSYHIKSGFDMYPPCKFIPAKESSEYNPTLTELCSPTYCDYMSGQPQPDSSPVDPSRSSHSGNSDMAELQNIVTHRQKASSLLLCACTLFRGKYSLSCLAPHPYCTETGARTITSRANLAQQELGWTNRKYLKCTCQN